MARAAGAGQGVLEWARGLPVRPDVAGPHVRLGVAWAALTLVAVVAGHLWLAGLLAPTAGVAGAQAARSWRRRTRRPAVAFAGGGAALIVVAATMGPPATAATAALVVLVVALASSAGGGHADPVLTSAIPLVVGLAAAAPVLLRADGLVPALVLVTFAHVYDASAYVVGAGAPSPWEGPAAGVASIGAVTLAVAAVFVPPFRGATPWLLGGLAVVLAPLGPCVGSALLGDRRVRAPALRRLDSLLVLGPLWALAASLALR